MAALLVIDDEPCLRDILEKVLSMDGHIITTVPNGREGLRLAGMKTFDLVITDIVMPEMDGFEVIMALRRTFPHIRIIVMTGGTAKLDLDALLSTARLMKVDRVLAKPIEFEQLVMIVNETLASEPGSAAKLTIGNRTLTH